MIVTTNRRACEQVDGREWVKQIKKQLYRYAGSDKQLQDASLWHTCHAHDVNRLMAIVTSQLNSNKAHICFLMSVSFLLFDCKKRRTAKDTVIKFYIGFN